MNKNLTSSFGLVFIFGVILILVCIYNQQNLLTVIIPRPSVRFYHANFNHFDDSGDVTLKGVTLQTFDAHKNVESHRDYIEPVPETTEKWPYDSPVIRGWEPYKSTNISVYLRPGENTTLIMPKLPFNETVSALGSVRPRIYALIVCQSSFGEAGYELRQAIRQSWASGTKPIKLICCKPIKARSDNAANLWQMHYE